MADQGAGDDVGREVHNRMVTFLNDFISQSTLEAMEVDGVGADADEDATQPLPDYQSQISSMLQGDTSTLFVDFSHLLQHDAELAEVMETEFSRFEGFVRSAIRTTAAATHPQHFESEPDPPREYYIGFYNMPRVERVRSLRTDRIGRLMSMSSTVIRTSDIRPELISARFTCAECGQIITDVEQQLVYTEPRRCTRRDCHNVRNWHLDVAGSNFIDWQRVRVQENANEIPPGSMPRSVDVILRHEIVERAKAGDKVIFTGTLMVAPDTSSASASLGRAGESAYAVKSSQVRGGADVGGVTGLQKMGVQELTYRMVFIACSVLPADSVMGGNNIRDDFDTEFAANNSAMDLAADLTDAEKADIVEMAAEPDLYRKMCASIAPNIFSYMEVKRGILLMLFGGVHKETPEGIQLRGDLNVCIVGDPSTAKSQFLKYVHGFLPRAVFASGKASSAAGLTACVKKDPDTGEFCVEAGALMLADNGICCIDEFDKMDNADQVAIHEAMEQQTISITKAGIQATLNARASILAAANPLFGRYDRSKTLKSNLQISAPIMSRFDIFFVVLDECDDAADYNIAQHIIHVHQDQAEVVEGPFSKERMQRYIRFARRLNPIIMPESKRTMVECYRALRQNDSIGRNKTAYRITVRQLESMVRLSEALARLHLDDYIRPRYVKEAYRLLQKSIIHVESEDVVLDDEIGDGALQEIPADENEVETTLLDTIPEGGAGNHSDLVENDENLEMVDEGGHKELLSGSGDHKRQQKTKKRKRKQQITFEQYLTMTNAIASHLRQIEERRGAIGELWNSVVDWYCEQHESGLSSEDDLTNMKQLVNMLLKRLITSDGVLVYVDRDESKPRGERQIAVHPNHQTDEM